MLLKTLVLFIGLTLANTVLSQAPDWVTENGKSKAYPSSTYLTGMGITSTDPNNTREEWMKIAKQNATAALAESIQSTVKSNSLLELKEENDVIHEQYSNTVQTISTIELQGLAFEYYHDEKSKLIYSLAIVDQKKTRTFYEDKHKQLSARIDKLYQESIELNSSGQKNQAIGALLHCLPAFRTLNEISSVLKTLDSKYDVTTPNNQENNVNTLLQELVSTDISDLKEAANYISFCFSKQFDADRKQIVLENFSFEDTPMTSPFSRFFHKVLRGQLTALTQLQVLEQSNETTHQLSTDLIISGSYWDQGDNIRILTIARETSTGKVVGNAEVNLPKKIFRENNLELKPQNFEQAYSDMKAFRKDEVIKGGMAIDLWTNKGKNNLIFEEEEKMFVYLRVNVTCHIRLVYHTADGRRVLLEENYYIDQSKVNKVYELPDSFECVAPFGCETLQVFAQSETFQPLKTYEEDGITFIRDDLIQVLGKTRGFKKNKKSNNLFAEQRVVITTMPKTSN